MSTKPGRAPKFDGEALAVRIREELARRRMTRQALADAAKISISTLEKVLAGRRAFTLATVIRLEEGLGARLLDRPAANAAADANPGCAPDDLGNYNRPSVAWLEGSYLTIRPSFGHAGALYAYRTDIAWDATSAALHFREHERTDKDYAQFGSVAVPHQSGHVYLITNRHGQHRLIVIAKPTITGDMHGILTTLHVGKGAHLSPIATPIVLRPLGANGKTTGEHKTPAYGRVPPGHAAHGAYAALLQKTLAENFAAFIPA